MSREPVTSTTSEYGPATEHAYQRIRSLILSGELVPDTILSQVQLSQRLGVSRTPLREAIRRLEQEGLLLASARRRVRVAPVDMADFDTLCAMRIITEALAIRMTVPLLGDTDLEHLQALHQRLRYGRESVAEAWWDDAHREFHRALVAGGTGRVKVTIDSIYDHAARYRVAAVPWWRTPNADLEIAGHAAVLDAVRARDAALAARLLAAHHLETVLDPTAVTPTPGFGECIRQAAALVLHEPEGTDPSTP